MIMIRLYFVILLVLSMIGYVWDIQSSLQFGSGLSLPLLVYLGTWAMCLLMIIQPWERKD